MFLLLMEVYISSCLASMLDSAPNASGFCLMEQRLFKSDWETLKSYIKLSRESLISRQPRKYSQLISSVELKLGAFKVLKVATQGSNTRRLKPLPWEWGSAFLATA